MQQGKFASSSNVGGQHHQLHKPVLNLIATKLSLSALFGRTLKLGIIGYLMPSRNVVQLP
jgi:hypothetical protein